LVKHKSDGKALKTCRQAIIKPVAQEILSEIRGRIDEIDEQIAALLAKRLACAKSIAPIQN